jgi:predicted RNase H-like HicB family nuclease
MTAHVVKLKVIAGIAKDCSFWTEDDGWSGVCEELAITVRGSSFEDAKAEMAAALQEHIEIVLRTHSTQERKKVAWAESEPTRYSTVTSKPQVFGKSNGTLRYSFLRAHSFNATDFGTPSPSSTNGGTLRQVCSPRPFPFGPPNLGTNANAKVAGAVGAARAFRALHFVAASNSF